MTLATTSHLARRARLAKAPAPGAFSATSTELSCHRQQVRGIRFGRIWTSYDPDFNRDNCRRGRRLRYTYIESLKQNIPWENLARDHKSTVRRTIHNCWNPDGKNPKPADKSGKPEPQPLPENPDGSRPGRNIEDAERAPMEHLLFGKNGESQHYEYDHSQSPFQNIRNKLRSRLAQAVGAEAAPRTKGAASDAEIRDSVDPSTDQKKSCGKNPVYSFKAYRSQFARPRESAHGPAHDRQEPIFYHGHPPEGELKKHGRVELDSERVQWHRYIKFGSWSQGPHLPRREDRINKKDSASTDELPKYDDLAKYKPVLDDVVSADAAKSPKYEDLDQYGAFRSQEPDGKYKREADEAVISTEREELDKYGAIWSNEPDGKDKGKAVQDGALKGSAELGKYKAVRHHEPDGKYKFDVDAQEAKYDPEELAKYGAVRHYEPDGMYKVNTESASNQYNPSELDKYNAVRSHEPNGKYKSDVEAQDTKYDPEELARYGAVRHYEPDGKYKADIEKADEPYDPEELARYGAVRAYEPDGKYKVQAEYSEREVDPEELARYGAFRAHEPDGKYKAEAEAEAEAKPAPSEYGPEELSRYGAFRSHEPDGKYANQPAMEAEPTPLDRYGASEYNAPLVTPDSLDPAEVEKYKAVRHNEPDGKPTDPVEISYDPAAPNKYVEEPYNPEEVNKYQAFRWNEPDGKPDNQASEKTNYQKMIESLLPGYHAHAIKPHKETEQVDKPKSDSMTGNYVRDFPGDFTQSWSSQNSVDKSSLLPNNMESKKGADESASTTTATSDAVVQPALDRHTKAGRGLLEKQVTPEEPTLYKILAYNSTMQTIEVAETTSIVPDSASPLTPAEVLLRLSNPSKFFPHFSPLRAQGFEIVSGNGDVLVFRKVRSAETSTDTNSVSAATKANTTVDTSSDACASNKPMNPIDKTGGRREIHSIAGSQCASPTGFVNYQSSTLPPKQRFESGIDVRREEDVFSGRKTDGSSNPKSSIPKRLAISAAWVGGISYAIGVVSEYFKTGGSDGKGPEGF